MTDTNTKMSHKDLRDLWRSLLRTNSEVSEIQDEIKLAGDHYTGEFDADLAAARVRQADLRARYRGELGISSAAMNHITVEVE